MATTSIQREIGLLNFCFVLFYSVISMGILCFYRSIDFIISDSIRIQYICFEEALLYKKKRIHKNGKFKANGLSSQVCPIRL